MKQFLPVASEIKKNQTIKFQIELNHEKTLHQRHKINVSNLERQAWLIVQKLLLSLKKTHSVPGFYDKENERRTKVFV